MKSFSFKPSKENAEIVERYIEMFPEKSRSDVLSEAVLEVAKKALGVSKQTDSSINEDSPPPKGSVSSSSPFSQESSLGETPQCFCRYEHNGLLWCANRPPPSSAQITTLKRCSACLKRITKDKISSGLRVKTRYYPICGARESYDKKKGLMLYCSKHFQGQWVTPKDCETVHCIDLKKVKGQW